jgi:hypothetical protein
MSMKRLLAVTAALLMFAAPAFAAETFEDPDDMTGPLDVRELVWTDKGDDVHTFRLTTDDNWHCSYISKLSKMLWYFDGRGDRDMDLIGKVRCLDPQEGPRELVMFLSGTESGNSYEAVPVRKPNNHTMRVTFTFDIPELSGPHVDLVIRVRDGVAEGCTSGHKCIERAPDEGRWSLY